MSLIPVITIDGPSGTGKGTISNEIARDLGWKLLDSGAIYRVLALAALNSSCKLDDEAALARLAENLDVRFLARGGVEDTSVILENRDVSADIRSENCGNAASRIASLPRVREALLERQRRFRSPPGLVADGRDMGTVVFPDAGLKVYLTASMEERVQRRYKQLKAKGISVNLQRLSADIAERDARDTERNVSPLKPAADAIEIDTTEMDINSVKCRVLDLVRGRFPGQVS